MELVPTNLYIVVVGTGGVCFTYVS
jgi:hypothetical protein